MFWWIFIPLFPKKNDQNHPNQEPRALNRVFLACLKALTSIFWLVKRVSTFYRPAESEETDILKPGFDGFSPHFSQRKWPESPTTGAPCLKVHRHSLFEGPDISLLASEASLLLLLTGKVRRSRHFKAMFWWNFITFSKESDQNHPN